MTPEMEAIAERTRGELAVTYAEAIDDEDRRRPDHVSPPDMHVAMLEGAARFIADVILAGRDEGSEAARMYVAEYVVQRVGEQMSAAFRADAAVN